MESPCVFGDDVGMVVLNSQEELCLVKFGFVVLVCFDLGGSYRIVASVLDNVLVGCPDVAVFSKRPWPSVEVDCLVVNGICRGDGGLVVDRDVCREGGKGREKCTCNFSSSRGDRFTVKAAVELESAVDSLVVLGNIAFMNCDGCMSGSFDMPCAESAEGGELVVSSNDRSVSKDVRCIRGGFVDGCHLDMLKLKACVSAECLSEFACVVVIVECPVSFCFGNPWPVPFEEGIREDAVFNDGEWFLTPWFVLSPEWESGIRRDSWCPSCMCEDVWKGFV